MQPDSAAHDHRDQRQIELRVDDQLAIATYVIEGEVITFDHTFVPESLRGRGLAKQLIEEGLKVARTESLKVVPLCTAFAAYMKSHPQSHDLLAPAGQALVGA